MITYKITDGINGAPKIPGDKSISHRSIIIPSISKGICEINNCLDGIESSLRNLSTYVNTYNGSDSINHLRSSIFGGYYSHTSYVGPYVTFVTFDSIYPSGC